MIPLKILKLIWNKIIKWCICICIFRSKCINCEIIITKDNYKNINGEILCLDCIFKMNKHCPFH